MDTQNESQQGDRRSASWLVLAVAALIVGGFIGYYLGSSGVGTGLVPDRTMQDDSAATTTIEGEADVEEPANPFEDDGYQNPFE